MKEVVFKIKDESDAFEIVAGSQNGDVIDWGLKRINAELAWKKSRGRGVSVAVLDTGICVNHPDLRQNIAGTANFSKSKHDVEDQSGHGSHVAGIIAAVDNGIGMIGVAPEAKLYAAKVLNDDGSGSMSNIVKGIRWAIAQGVDIINLSLGSQKEPSKDLHEAVKEAIRHDIVIVAAAGNENSDIDWPARYPETICVSAVDDKDSRASFSNMGVENVIAAPGVDITSTYKDNQYAKLSGTSMACPIISGAAALYIAYIKETEHRKPSTKEVYEALTHAVDDVGKPGRDEDYGNGIINLAKLYK